MANNHGYLTGWNIGAASMAASSDVEDVSGGSSLRESQTSHQYYNDIEVPSIHPFGSSYTPQLQYSYLPPPPLGSTTQSLGSAEDQSWFHNSPSGYEAEQTLVSDECTSFNDQNHGDIDSNPWQSNQQSSQPEHVPLQELPQSSEALVQWAYGNQEQMAPSPPDLSNQDFNVRNDGQPVGGVIPKIVLNYRFNPSERKRMMEDIDEQLADTSHATASASILLTDASFNGLNSGELIQGHDLAQVNQTRPTPNVPAPTVPARGRVVCEICEAENGRNWTSGSVKMRQTEYTHSAYK
jgi:hypothetical protein